MKVGRYGVDAPGLVRAFLIVGVIAGASGLIVIRWGGSRAWATWIAAVLAIFSIYGLGMFIYMLWGSLVTKVRGRDAILDLIDWSGREQVLDIGCGRGLLLVGAARRLTSGRAIGIDLWLKRDQSANEQAAPLRNAEVEGVADRVVVETGDARRLPFEDHTFDVVMSHWVIHNLELETDRTTALGEMLRVLRPGGMILLTDIALRNEYQAAFNRFGVKDVRLVIASRLRDTINKMVSFGSFQPATIVAKSS